MTIRRIDRRTLSATNDRTWNVSRDVSRARFVISWLLGVLVGGAVAIALLSLPLTARAAPVCWENPTHNVDGTPLTDLVRVIVHWGPTADQYTHTRDVETSAPGARTCAELAALGTVHVAVTAVNAEGEESANSNVRVVDTGSAPPPPTTTTTSNPSSLPGYGTTSAFGDADTSPCSAATFAELRACFAAITNGTPDRIEVTADIEFPPGTDINVLAADWTLDCNGNVLTFNRGAQLTPVANGDLSAAHDFRITNCEFRPVESNEWDQRSDGGNSQDAVFSINCGVGADGNRDINFLIDRNTFLYAKDSAGDLWKYCQSGTFYRNFWGPNYHPMSTAVANASDNHTRISWIQNLFMGSRARTPQIRGETSDLEFVNNVNMCWGDDARNGDHAMRILDRNGAFPNRINVIGNIWLTGGCGGIRSVVTQQGINQQEAVVFGRGFDASRCYMEGNVFPVGETTRCAGAREFNRADATLAPPRIPVENLESTLLAVVSNPSVGTTTPSVTVRTMLGAAKAALAAQFGGVVVPPPPPEPEPFRLGVATQVGALTASNVTLTMGVTGEPMTVAWSGPSGPTEIELIEHDGVRPVLRANVPGQSWAFTPPRAGLYVLRARQCNPECGDWVRSDAQGHSYFFSLATPTGGGIE